MTRLLSTKPHDTSQVLRLFVFDSNISTCYKRFKVGGIKIVIPVECFLSHFTTEMALVLLVIL